MPIPVYYVICILFIIYWTIISASAPRGGATRTLLITLNFIDLTNCNNCVYGFYSKFGWFINDCKTHGFLMNFTIEWKANPNPLVFVYERKYQRAITFRPRWTLRVNILQIILYAVHASLLKKYNNKNIFALSTTDLGRPRNFKFAPSR